ASVFQALVVEREHHVESFAVDPWEFRLQQVFVEWPVVRVDEAVLIEFEPRADPHRVVGVPVGNAGASLRDAVSRLLLDAEQEIENRRGGGRLARLVEAVDDVEVRTAGRGRAELERIVAEPTVTTEIKPPNPHAARSRSAARRCASTSSAPSRAMRRRMFANSSASRPSRSSREAAGNWLRISAARSRSAS